MTAGSRQGKDRQIILDQFIWNDFPSKGATTVHYENVEADKQWPATDSLRPLKVTQLDYVMVPKDKGTELTTFSAIQLDTIESGWIVNMAVQRTPVDWINGLSKAVIEYENGSLRGVNGGVTVDTRASTAQNNFV